jgi:cation diffusion facilitator family transporter
MSADTTNLRAVLAALLANLGVAAAKLIGFVLSGSGSMLAEFIHSVADTGNQTVLLLGRRRAKHRPDRSHPFGYGAFRFLGAFVVAGVLFGLGSLFSVAEGVLKLVHPHPLDHLPIALGILAVTFLLESFSFRTAVLAARQSKGQESWLAFVRTTRVPELAVLLVEDSGALIGLGFALLALALSAATGNTVFDAAGSLAIGVLLGVNAILLGTEMTSLLVGETASATELDRIREAIASTRGIARLVHLRAVHLGPEELLVAAKVVFDPGKSAEEAAGIVDDAEVAIRAAVPTARWVYIEPGRTSAG